MLNVYLLNALVNEYYNYICGVGETFYLTGKFLESRNHVFFFHLYIPEQHEKVHKKVDVH